MSYQPDIFDNGDASQPGERQIDLEQLIAEKKATDMNNPSPTCDNCGSVDVYRKRIAYFSPKVETWIDDPFCDEYHCNKCGNESVDMSAWFGSAKKAEASA